MRRLAAGFRGWGGKVGWVRRECGGKSERLLRCDLALHTFRACREIELVNSRIGDLEVLPFILLSNKGFNGVLLPVAANQRLALSHSFSKTGDPIVFHVNHPPHSGTMPTTPHGHRRPHSGVSAATIPSRPVSLRSHDSSGCVESAPFGFVRGFSFFPGHRRCTL